MAKRFDPDLSPSIVQIMELLLVLVNSKKSLLQSFSESLLFSLFLLLDQPLLMDEKTHEKILKFFITILKNEAFQ